MYSLFQSLNLPDSTIKLTFGNMLDEVDLKMLIVELMIQDNTPQE